MKHEWKNYREETPLLLFFSASTEQRHSDSSWIITSAHRHYHYSAIMEQERQEEGEEFVPISSDNSMTATNKLEQILLFGCGLGSSLCCKFYIFCNCNCFCLINIKKSKFISLCLLPSWCLYIIDIATLSSLVYFKFQYCLPSPIFFSA